MNESKKPYQAPALLALSLSETRSGTLNDGENPGVGMGDAMMLFRDLVVNPLS
jgi:hypothetical protein